ncbi:MAG: hypothetical protein M0Q13_04700 [Methanothrix sp.]|nr:hypothetical protein [Methanothrix sp.]
MLGDRNALFLRSFLGKSDPLINLPTAGPENRCQDHPDRPREPSRMAREIERSRPIIAAAEKVLPIAEAHL